MKFLRVCDLMIPISDYATITRDATIHDAIKILARERHKSDSLAYRHHSVLVLGEGGRIEGKLSQVDIMRSLEPSYDTIVKDKSLNRFGLSRQFLKTMMAQFDLWDKPLIELCELLLKRKVGDFMYTPNETAYVNEKDTLDLAMHRIVLGPHHSLLVVGGDNEKIVGVLRSIDIFDALCKTVDECVK